jgi:hypothetical protein
MGTAKSPPVDELATVDNSALKVDPVWWRAWLPFFGQPDSFLSVA